MDYQLMQRITNWEMGEEKLRKKTPLFPFTWFKKRVNFNGAAACNHKKTMEQKGKTCNNVN